MSKINIVVVIKICIVFLLNANGDIMGTCPNCGSYVSPGSNVCSCGTTFAYVEEKKDPEEERYNPEFEEYCRIVRRAEGFMKDGDYLGAIEMFDRAIERYPMYGRQSVKADAYYGAGMYEEAVECYRKRLSKSDSIDNYSIYCDIGKCFDALCRFDEAMDAYNEAIAIINRHYERKRSVHEQYKRMNSSFVGDYLDKNRDMWTSEVYRKMALTCMHRARHFIDDSDKNYADAIRYVGNAIKLDYANANGWNIKAIILEDMGKFEDSKRFYDISLEMERDDTVIENKAWMLKRWCNLLRMNVDLDKALKLICEAIDELSTIPGRDLSEYEEIKGCVERQIKCKRQMDFLKSIGRKNLITIAGTQFYGVSEFERGVMLRLLREPDNAYDSDAVAVYLGGEKVGYVANSQNTACELTSKASDLDIPDAAFAEYLLNYYECYHIARIIGEVKK